jgi:light-regulated signal transduction histidine kinase (bacteriophytochrome)
MAETARLAGGEVSSSFENRYRCKDGSFRWLGWRAAPVGSRSLIYAAARDITDEKRAARELQERATELEAVNSELEAFSYSVSHDLRSPLRSIDGFSQALLEDYEEKLDEEGKDYLRRVRASTQRMGELIDDMLNMSRITRSDMHREPVDLTEMAQASAAELQKSAPEREVEFVIADGLTAQGDARLLRIVMDNLLGNAWKYTSKHPRACIEFGFAQNNEQSIYFVRDDGAGFDMTYADKLFGVFQRLHKQTEFPGTGVGLATVQRIMHRHGGRVWADAQVDKGATFYFTLSS